MLAVVGEAVGTGLEQVDPDATLALAAAVAGLLALAFVIWFAFTSRPRRPKVGPATMELLTEPPALVDLLTDRFEVTADALPATVLDLGARGFVRIEEPSSGNVLLTLTGADEAELLPYEKRVLHHIASEATDNQMPAGAIGLGPGADRWLASFRKEVIADARSRGLSRRRFGSVPIAIGWIGLSAAGILAFLSARDLAEGQIVAFTPALIVAIASVFVLGWANTRISLNSDERGTEAGYELGTKWLGIRQFLADHGQFDERPAASVTVWDQYLAYACALDLAPLAARQLPLAEEDDRHAWSNEGGRWRQINVDYLKLRPGWGHHPFGAFVSGVVVAAIAGAITYAAMAVAGDVNTDLFGEAWTDWVVDQGSTTLKWIARGAMATAVVFGLLTLWWAVRAVNGLLGIIGTTKMEGLVVRARMKGGPGQTRSELRRADAEAGALANLWQSMRRTNYYHNAGYQPNTKKPRYYLALDDGSADEIDAWRVEPDIYRMVAQGQRARVSVKPRTGFVKNIEPAGPPPPPPPPTDQAVDMVGPLLDDRSRALYEAAQALLVRRRH